MLLYLNRKEAKNLLLVLEKLDVAIIKFSEMSREKQIKVMRDAMEQNGILEIAPGISIYDEKEFENYYDREVEIAIDISLITERLKSEIV